MGTRQQIDDLTARLRRIPGCAPEPAGNDRRITWFDGPGLTTVRAELTGAGYTIARDDDSWDGSGGLIVLTPAYVRVTLDRQIRPATLLTHYLADHPGIDWTNPADRHHLLPLPDQPAAGTRPQTPAQEVAHALMTEHLPDRPIPARQCLMVIENRVDEHFGSRQALLTIGALAGRE
jgi:hypothetical protein